MTLHHMDEYFATMQCQFIDMDEWNLDDKHSND